METLSEYLFRYILETTSGRLNAQADYQQAKAERDAAEEALEAALTEEQRALLEVFIERYNFQSFFEEQHIFEEALALIPALLFPA